METTGILHAVQLNLIYIALLCRKWWLFGRSQTLGTVTIQKLDAQNLSIPMVTHIGMSSAS